MRLIETITELGEIAEEVGILLRRAEELLQIAGQSSGAKAVGRARKAVERVMGLEIEALGEIDTKKGTR